MTTPSQQHRPVNGHQHRPVNGRLNQEIANAVVRGHKRFLGRGPTRAQAFFRHNIVVVVMDASLSEAERSLARHGSGDAVLEMRHRFEEMMRSELVQAVENLTGCKVEAFMTSHHIDPDLAAELFVLDRPVPAEPSPPVPDS
ncbi:MAG TPA: DUF2294 domain-containing protein [Solirubrobacteraceae bacterium]|nr:DUF2294 domain-containing protein [Solirubrobacteraceae bacterium]